MTDHLLTIKTPCFFAMIPTPLSVLRAFWPGTAETGHAASRAAFLRRDATGRRPKMKPVISRICSTLRQGADVSWFEWDRK